MGGLLTVEELHSLASGPQVHGNLPVAQLVECALKRGEGRLAANGALVAAQIAVGLSAHSMALLADAAATTVTLALPRPAWVRDLRRGEAAVQTDGLRLSLPADGPVLLALSPTR